MRGQWLIEEIEILNLWSAAVNSNYWMPQLIWFCLTEYWTVGWGHLSRIVHKAKCSNRKKVFRKPTDFWTSLKWSIFVSLGVCDFSQIGSSFMLQVCGNVKKHTFLPDVYSPPSWGLSSCLLLWLCRFIFLSFYLECEIFLSTRRSFNAHPLFYKRSTMTTYRSSHRFHLHQLQYFLVFHTQFMSMIHATKCSS